MIKSIQALAVVKKAKPVINANGIFHKADRAFIIIASNELLIDVTITPIEKNTTKERNKSDEKKRIQEEIKGFLQNIKGFPKETKKKVAKQVKKRVG